GIMLFGFRRVSNRVHTLATFLVAAGTTASAFWIMVLNAWMHTPAGFEMRDGVAHALNWGQIIFNPSMPYRLAHMLLASGLTVAFLVAGVSAYRWLRQDRSPAVMAALRTGVTLGAVLIPLQIIMGDLHGLNTLKYQPAKIAAIEGVWETEQGVPLLLFAVPDEEERKNHFEIGIPKAASLILTHEWDGEIKGLNEFEGQHPPVAPLFYGFRIMVGVGMLMLLVSWWGVWQLRRQGSPNVWLSRALLGMTFSGWVATVAGWYVTEIGRQPYLVYGVLKTSEAASGVPGPMIALTLALYLTVYLALTAAYISVVFYLARKAGQKNPDATEKLALGTAAS
ncbi:MAG: cytochrome ubiquinol oxidase subunit I, partial [Burkholderiales bacterium]|nr:cytochrome ubiquinol oxidase subunit I [Burkholderiales bacterium]